MQKILAVMSVMLMSACNFDVTPTFYIRDVQDVISEQQLIDIPIFLKIPTSDVDSCQSEIGQVLGILKIYGMDGGLQSCSSDGDNFFALANVEFTATVVASTTSQADSFTGIVGLIVEESQDGVYYLCLAPNFSATNFGFL